MIRIAGQDEKLTAFAFLKDCLPDDPQFHSGAETILNQLQGRMDEDTWIMEQEDSIRGVLIHDDSFRIRFLYVRNDCRHQGIGTDLLNQMAEQAQRIGYARITVQAFGPFRQWLVNQGFETDEDDENAVASLEYLCGRSLLGKTVQIIVDQPYGSLDLRTEGIRTCNVGYMKEEDVMEDREIIPAYVTGVHQPLETFTGVVIGLIYHKEDHLIRVIAAPHGMIIDRKQVISEIGMMEQYYESRMIFADGGNA
ncbi:MAG: GNAT family N-acetyltransferase [Bulleidia sp.]